MKEIRIFLASSYELEPDRARIGNLIRRLNDKYEKQFIHLRLVKWEDLDSFYNSTGKQGEYDSQICTCDFFVALFWHRAGCFTVHEVEVARGSSINPRNILIFRKDAPFPEDYEGSEDIKRFCERFANNPEALSISEQELEQFIEAQQPFLIYREFSELEAVLTRKLEEYCSSIVVSEEEKKQTFSGDAIQIHVAASPEIEPDLARLGDLIRNLDENSKHYCRIRMIPELPGCDMFVSMCHTSAPKQFQDEIASAIETRKQSGQDRPYLYFCIKYLEAGTQKERSLDELEQRFSENLAHFPDRYTQAPEMKLHFILQLERLKHSSSSDAMLIVKKGILYQKNGDSENPLMSCDDMVSLQKDEDYQEMKHRRDELEAEIAELKKQDRSSDQNLSQEIHCIYEELCDIEEQIENRQRGCLRLARLIEDMIGKEQDESILRIRKLVQDGQIERALKRLPKPKDLCLDIEEMLRKHQAELQRYYDVCKLTISCLLASNARKNRDVVCELYEKLIALADTMKNDKKKVHDCLEYAKILYDSKQYDKALEFLQIALGLRLGSLGENHPATANVYNKIGYIWFKKGDYDKALEFCNKALEIRLHTLGENHPDVAASYNNVGLSCNHRGEFDKALEFFGKALAIRIRLFGEDDSVVEKYYFYIGNILSEKGEFDKALGFYEKVQDGRKHLLGKDHPSVAKYYYYMGNILSKKGEFDKALEFYGKALDAKIRNYVPRTSDRHSHSDQSIAHYYDRMGDVCTQKGDFDKALEFLGKALDAISRHYNNPRSICFAAESNRYYGKMGIVCQKKGDFDKALEFLGKALDSGIRNHPSLGEKHPDLVPYYNMIGDVWFQKGDFDKALEFYDKALDILLQVPEEEKPNRVQRFLTDIAYAYIKKGKSLENLGRREEAGSCFEKARAIAVNHPDNELCRMILENTKEE